MPQRWETSRNWVVLPELRLKERAGAEVAAVKRRQRKRS